MVCLGFEPGPLDSWSRRNRGRPNFVFDFC